MTVTLRFEIYICNSKYEKQSF